MWPIAQIRSRLQHCRAFHESCKPSPSPFRPNRFLCLGRASDKDDIVKVVRAQNLRNGDTEPYATLSYCWGQNQVFKTTLANKVDVEADGIPLRLLPKTIKDAIHLTRELNIDLLWVDSLCLVQDDKKELAKEIAQMHHYYSNSCITISAAAASSCSQGFLQTKPMSHQSEDDILGPFYFPLIFKRPRKRKAPLARRMNMLLWRKVHSWRRMHSWRQRRSWIKLPPLQRTPPSLKLVVRSSPTEVIDSRAWTLQEGLLAHRLVSFGSRAVRWSCQKESFGTERKGYLRDSWRTFHSGISDDHGRSNNSYLRFWCNLVENYTARALSDEQDRLAAISGIVSILCETPVAQEASANEQNPASVGSTPRGEADVRVSPPLPEQGLAGHVTPLKTLRSLPDLDFASFAGSLSAIGQAQYAAGLLDKPIPMIIQCKARNGEEMVQIPRKWWNSGKPDFKLGSESRLLIFQLLWIPRITPTGKGTRSAQSSSTYVAPSWSWASRGVAVDTCIPRIDDNLLDKIQYAIWEAGFKVQDVTTVPKSLDAPYGALFRGSLTVKSTVIQLDTHKRQGSVRIALDTDGQDTLKHSQSGLICLQIIPELQGLQAKELPQLHGVPHGLVLEPVDLGGQYQTGKKVYRRVGVYYTDYPSDGPDRTEEGSEDVKTDSKFMKIPLGKIHDLLKQHAGPVEDRQDEITMI